MKNILLGILAFVAVFLVSCTNSKAENTQITNAQFKTGDIVPHDQVCMVNNAYMGKKQLEVKHDGKTYYGCCENCKLRIPQEENARMAYDPISHQLIDKQPQLSRSPIKMTMWCTSKIKQTTKPFLIINNL